MMLRMLPTTFPRHHQTKTQTNKYSINLKFAQKHIKKTTTKQLPAGRLLRDGPRRRRRRLRPRLVREKTRTDRLPTVLPRRIQRLLRRAPAVRQLAKQPSGLLVVVRVVSERVGSPFRGRRWRSLGSVVFEGVDPHLAIRSSHPLLLLKLGLALGVLFLGDSSLLRVVAVPNALLPQMQLQIERDFFARAEGWEGLPAGGDVAERDEFGVGVVLVEEVHGADGGHDAWAGGWGDGQRQKRRMTWSCRWGGGWGGTVLLAGIVKTVGPVKNAAVRYDVDTQKPPKKQKETKIEVLAQIRAKVKMHSSCFFALRNDCDIW